MPGPPPKDPRLRRRRNTPRAGEWEALEGAGWQHGPVPDPPDGLLEASRVAWATWMGAWFAAHWGPADLPGLEVTVRLYDQVVRGEFKRAAEARHWQDAYGITPVGRQQRRWAPPESEPERQGSSGGKRRLRAVE